MNKRKAAGVAGFCRLGVIGAIVLGSLGFAFANSAPFSTWSFPYPSYGSPNWNYAWDLGFWGGIPIDVEASDPDGNLVEHYVSVEFPDHSVSYINLGGPVDSGSINTIYDHVYTSEEGPYTLYSSAKDSNGVWNHAPFYLTAFY